ncbi:MAG: nucleoside/nucleotide kinase family protein [Planctomycetota bacterium]
MTVPPPLPLTEHTIRQLSRELVAAARAAAPGRRWVVGIAGIAGSGKSTLAKRLLDEANLVTPGIAVVIALDGFHLRNREIARRGWQTRKGAAFTYDVGAYAETLNRYSRKDHTGPFPVYCRVVHDPVPSEQEVTARTRLIITEGQYLLSAAKQWSPVAAALDETWWLDTPLQQAEQWLLKRDLSVGRSVQEARNKYRLNDRINTAFVLSDRLDPERVVGWP